MKASWLLGVVAAVLLILAVVWHWFPQMLPTWATRAISAHTPLNPPLYKWRDAKGRWNITDTPPADRPYETVRYDPDTNVVPNEAPRN